MFDSSDEMRAVFMLPVEDVEQVIPGQKTDL